MEDSKWRSYQLGFLAGNFCLFFSMKGSDNAKRGATRSRGGWNGVSVCRGRWIMVPYDIHPSLQWIRRYLFWVVQCPLAESNHTKVSSEESWQDSRIWFLIQLSNHKQFISSLVCDLSRSCQVSLSCLDQVFPNQQKGKKNKEKFSDTSWKQSYIFCCHDNIKDNINLMGSKRIINCE